MIQQNGYAETLLALGRPAEAAELLQVTERMSPASKLRYTLTLTEAHLANGNRPRAHDCLTQALSLDSQVGLSYYRPQIATLTEKL